MSELLALAAILLVVGGAYVTARAEIQKTEAKHHESE